MRRLDIATHTPSFWSCKSFSCRAWGFSDDHNRVFCVLTYPEKWNQASSVKKVTSRKSTFVWIKLVNQSQQWIRSSWSAGFNSCTAMTLYGKSFNFSRTALCAVASPVSSSCTNLCNDFDGLCSTVSEMSINFTPISLDGLPLRSASNTEPVSQNFSKSLRTALRWGTGVPGYFSANCFCTKSVYLLPSRKTYSTRKTHSSIKRTTVSKNWIKELNTLPVLHFSRCLTTEYREMSHNNSTLQRQLQYWQSYLRRLCLTGYPLHSPVSPSLPLLCVNVCHHISTGLYHSPSAQRLSKRTV